MYNTKTIPKKVEVNGRTFIALSEYAKKMNVPIQSVQTWIRRGNFKPQDMEKVSQIIYAQYLEEYARPQFKRPNKRRKVL